MEVGGLGRDLAGGEAGGHVGVGAGGDGLGDRQERVGQRVHGLLAVGGGLCEAAQEDRLDLRGDAGVRGRDAQRPGRLLDVHRHQAHGVGVGEGHAAGQQLVGDDAERVDVAARVDRLAAGLLGGDVAGQDGRAVARVRADRAGELLEDRGADDLERLVLVLVAHGVAVAGLERAEHDAVAVQAVEDLAQAHQQAAGAGPRQATAAGEHGREVVAVDEVGDDEQLALEGHADVEDVDEVDQRAGLAALDRQVALDAGADAGDEARLGDQRGHQHADRDRLVELDVVGPEHRAGRPLAHRRDDAVAVGEERADQRGPGLPTRCIRGLCPEGPYSRLRLVERRHFVNIPQYGTARDRARPLDDPGALARRWCAVGCAPASEGQGAGGSMRGCQRPSERAMKAAAV